ncbi:NBS-containing resistance-like protein [Trifolium medium]|uniref:NBS-containing resistance-like protein n=1 Tax=Trifolium medium TaxID=97028 RepID=A0A392RNU1_9FABA|nr:NBS-containing resistance-like protein [Trifolium medium]
MIAKVEIKGEASATAYGGSLKKEHEESGWDVVRFVQLIKDNIPKHIVDSYGFDKNDIQNAQRVVEQVLKARLEFMRGKGHEGWILICLLSLRHIILVKLRVVAIGGSWR